MQASDMAVRTCSQHNQPQIVLRGCVVEAYCEPFRLPSQGPAPQSVLGFFFGAGMAQYHAIHARHLRGLFAGRMEARKGSCNAGRESSVSECWNSGSWAPFLLSCLGGRGGFVREPMRNLGSCTREYVKTA